jgi:hypothetical protein
LSTLSGKISSGLDRESFSHDLLKQIEIGTHAQLSTEGMKRKCIVANTL